MTAHAAQDFKTLLEWAMVFMIASEGAIDVELVSPGQETSGAISSCCSGRHGTSTCYSSRYCPGPLSLQWVVVVVVVVVTPQWQTNTAPGRYTRGVATANLVLPPHSLPFCSSACLRTHLPCSISGCYNISGGPQLCHVGGRGLFSSWFNWPWVASACASAS